MRILFEQYPYQLSDVERELQGIYDLQDVEKRINVSYVGYFYNPAIQDCVFILPKVLLKDEDVEVDGRVVKMEVIAGVTEKENGGFIRPEDIITPEGQEKILEPEYRKFIYEFAVWIYRSLDVYRKANPNTNAIYFRQLPESGGGRRHKAKTFLDIVLSLIRFNEENQNYFLFTIKNLHAGFNKINWTRTIARTPAVIQGNNAIYLNPVNKRRVVNFDEELFVIFFSILNYLNEQYGFRTPVDIHYDIIAGQQFERYMKGFGKKRLRQIRYKYFSDKALELWHLCMAFFDSAHEIAINTTQKEYLLAKKFEIVFEAMIDELVGDNPLPDGMDKKQEDGKIVDHLFTAKSLIEGEMNPTYYIGDSKYYKMGHPLGSESIYKQYTYARNVIQWNLDIFNRGETTESSVKLRDDVTEGYNIIPNFFISAKMDEAFDYANDGIEKTDREHNRHRKEQFKNRLFDRDTLLLFHYDVNFLFVLSLYARNNSSQKAEWKRKIRDKFRKEIQDWLQDDFDFYAMAARPGVDAKQYFRTHFQDVLGKTYTPFADNNIFSLALDNKDPEKNNEALLAELQKFFIVEKCKLGDKPEPIIKAARIAESGSMPAPEKDGVLMVMMESYDAKSRNFLASGKLAIGIKYTKDSMEIVEHLSSIGYVLFHQRKTLGQHLFAVKGACKVDSSADVEIDRYKNVNTTEMYLSVDIDTSIELDVSALDSTKKEFTKATRYDAQYASINEITSGSSLKQLNSTLS